MTQILTDQPRAFDFESQAVRVMMRDDNPWFVAVDICAALGHSNSSVMISRLDDDEKHTLNIGADTLNISDPRAQSLALISEPGVYRLVFTSRTKAAERFKRWLAHDVLPAIRRTGFYHAPGEPLPDEGMTETLPMNADGKAWDVSVAKLNAAARMISNATRLYGPEAARRLWEADATLPNLRRYGVSSLAGTAEDDPAGCIQHLLRSVVRHEMTVGKLLRLGLTDALSKHALLHIGIGVDLSGHSGKVAIASTHRFLKGAYAETQWAGEWRHCLMQLNGAKILDGMRTFGKERSGAVLIPKETINDALSRCAPVAPPH